MTAWTAIVIPLFMIAKCSLDFIGMEYGSKYQAWTDSSFGGVATCMILMSLGVDMLNLWRRR